MYAVIGDRIIVKSPQMVGEGRDGEILEVRGIDGTPPYLVRWSDNGHESLLFPGPDSTVQHFSHDEAAERRPTTA
jgi:hypothetical protein